MRLSPDWAADIKTLINYGRVFMRVSVAAMAICLATVAISIAGNADASIRKPINIPAQPLESALESLAQERDLQVIYRSDIVVNVQSGGAVGLFTPSEAFDRLLVGTGLAYRYLNDTTVTITQASVRSSTRTTEAAPTITMPSSPTGDNDHTASVPWDKILVAQADRGEALPTERVEHASAKDPGQLEEIVVTAMKRLTTELNTPISLTAVSEKDIQERGVTDFTELAQSIPGVSMRTAGPAQTEFEMRGMSSFGGNSPTVGFYLDDVPVSGPSFGTNGKVVIDPNLYDLNRVEVLRGPQGTLYGSGSMGGTIKLIPNAPNLQEFVASAEAIMGDTDGGGFNHGENVMVNIPFGGGTAALRIVGSDSHASGWIDRIVIANGEFPLEMNPNGSINPSGTVRGDVLAAPVAADYKGVNSEDQESVRASVLWKPTDRLSITPSILYQRSQQPGLGNIDSDPGTNAHYEPLNVPESLVDRFNLYSVNVQYSFDAFDINSTTSQWYRESDTLEDGSESLQWALGLTSFSTSTGGIGPVSTLEEDKTQQTSEEIRFTSSGDSKFKWLVGYFYSDFGSVDDFSQVVPGAAPLYGSSNLLTQFQPVTIIQQAGFGELSYQLTPQLNATAGLRRYSYSGTVSTAQSGVFSLSGSDASVHLYTAERDQGVNPKFTLSYNPNQDTLLYATAAKGFRPGGGNTPFPVTGPTGAPCEPELQSIYGTNAFVPAPLSFGRDSVWSYELGEKMRALENRISVNSAVYYENWNGVQQSIPLGCGFAYQANAGDAHIYGAELEITAALASGLIASANAGYTHARIVSSDLLNAGIQPGTPIQDVPDWTSSQSLSYRHGLSNGLSFTARIENNYVGTRTDVSYAVNHLPSYDLTNLRAGVEGSRWAATLFAKNLLNKTILLNNITLLAVTLPTYNRSVESQPLTIGIDLTYRFGP
jgi:iron complex outermembrane receptor protein